MKDIYRQKGWQIKNRKLPILFIAGADDKIIINEKKWIKSQEFLKDVGYQKIDKIWYPEMKHEILNEVNKFSKDFPNIIKKIKKLAPEAEIYVNTVYNPINKKCNIYDFFDEQINLINDLIVKNNSNYDYKIFLKQNKLWN